MWWCRRILLALGALWAAVVAGAAPAQASGEVLRVAWSLQEPYQFLGTFGDHRDVTGIDVVSFGEAANAAGLTAVFRHMPWKQALQAVAEGEVDVVLAAFDTPERRAVGRFSDPLRYSEERLFLWESQLPDAADAPALLQAVRDAGLRIAVVSGYELGEDFEAFRNDPANTGTVVRVRSLDDALDLLEIDVVQGFVMDRLVGHQALADRRISGMANHPVALYEAPIAALFSRETVAAETVVRFDRALAALRAEGRLDTIQRRFVLPVMIDRALIGPWFEIILIVGMVAFSISAVVIARTGGYGLFGAVVLASLPALGGGVVRDLLILREPYVFAYPLYVYIVLATLLAGYLLNRLLDLLRGRSLLFFDLVNLLLILRQRLRPQLLMEIFDAAGIAAFTVVAVTIAVEFGREPLWLWGPVLAALTATGGAILRDMIRSDADNAILRGAFYGETVVLWSLPLCLYLKYFGRASEPSTIFWALMATMAGIFATRMAFVGFGWRAPRY